ncbi:glycine zipper 2TM domain-containing protein [Methylibium rhizosphaerae]|uniref:glycine zipper 2TM domain-containing protein n=1 Tax=Methylibium rhizosphaerae TaxID=2570323 RepID=UPI00112CC4C9|nr:glycine zipper 2TM domain-containing protein [Methylibium rhizosphaerae]
MNNPQPLDSATAMPQQGWRALPRAVWLVGGALLLTIAGLASALVMNRSGSEPETPAAVAENTAPAAPAGKTAKTPKAGGSSAQREAAAGHNNSYPDTRHMQPAVSVCATCGVVESVTPVTKKGEGTGLGAVAGGVVGGLLGNQVGKGDGRKAMTVVGAVGGGLAGHEIEKRARSETVYSVKVRMDDGSLRTTTQRQAPAVGQRVTLDGQALRAVSESQGAAGDAPRTWKTKSSDMGA